jgi:RimJ/RimL family protein N-acetyltransferase
VTVWEHLDLESDIQTERLLLTPLQPQHADLLFPLLHDEGLHRFIGGAPLTLEELRARYELLAHRLSADGKELWLNWIARRRGDDAVVGTMQATVSGPRAELAWVMGQKWQGRGYASEAARSIIEWLARHALVDEVHAHIHPQHVASERVARAAGFAATDVFTEGERVWRLRIDEADRAQPSTRGGS